jgi:hypothetical protein
MTGMFSRALASALAVTLGGLAWLAVVPAAHAADENVRVSIQPTGQVTASPSQPLRVLVTLTNTTVAALPASEATVFAPGRVLATVASVSDWLSAADGLHRSGTYLGSAFFDEVPAGATVTSTVTLNLSAAQFGSTWGPRGMLADLVIEGVSRGSGRSSFVWTAGEAPARASLTTVAPVLAPTATGGLLTAQELGALTSASGQLTRQLETLAGRPLTAAIDPRIPTSIATLGEAAPASAREWLASLQARVPERFDLAYADADVAGQAQVGVTTLVAPEGSPTPALVWPAATTVTAGNTAVFRASGATEMLLASGNLNLGTASPPTAMVDGLPTVVTNDALTSALAQGVYSTSNTERTAALAQGASLLAAAALDDSTQGHLVASLPRVALTPGQLGSTASVLDALGALPWVSQQPLSQVRTLPSSGAVEIIDHPEDPARVAQLASAIGQGASLVHFSSIVPDPAKLNSPGLRSLCATLSVAWMGNAGWNEALDSFSGQIFTTTHLVEVVSSSTVNMVGGQVNVPVTVFNGLSQVATVTVRATPSNPRIRVGDDQVITIQPKSQTIALVPVTARVGNGNVTLEISMFAADGTPVGSSARIPINVRADWEVWGLGVLAIAFVGLVGVGIVRTLRRRRDGVNER